MLENRTEIKMKRLSGVIVGYNKLTISLCCFCPLVLTFFITIIGGVFSLWILLLVISQCVIIYFILHLMLKSNFDELVSFETGKLIHRDSKYSGFKKSEININNPKSILWENESIAAIPGSRNSLYIIDEKSEKHVIVKNKNAGFLSIRKETLKKLSEALNIPIQKDYYSLTSDLKQRRKIEQAQWRGADVKKPGGFT